MRIGVKDNRLTVQLAAGYPPFESMELDSMLKRSEMACELLGAVVLLMRNDFATHRELVEFALDNLD